jgi:hypothetical protein
MLSSQVFYTGEMDRQSDRMTLVHIFRILRAISVAERSKEESKWS